MPSQSSMETELEASSGLERPYSDAQRALAISLTPESYESPNTYETC